MPSNPKNPSNPQNPYPGDLVIDVSALASVIVDLPEGETRGMLVEQEGFAEVIAEIIANQPQWAEKAGITATDFAEFQTANDIVTKIQSYLPAVRKLVELLEETAAKYDDQRQRFAYNLANTVERRAKARDDGGSLLAKYQRTRVYRSANAMKAAKTRRRNAANEAPGNGNTPPAPGASTSSSTTTPPTHL